MKAMNFIIIIGRNLQVKVTVQLVIQKPIPQTIITQETKPALSLIE